MALHETFTSDPGLAFLLGPARPDFNLGNTWFGSVSIWSGVILNPGSGTNPVVEVAVSGIPGVTHIQAEVFGTRTYDANGLASVAVSMIEWSLPGSATVLARYTFASPIPFPISISRFVGDWRFTDILNEIIAVGGTPQDLFNDYFQNADTLIGDDASDNLQGGGGDDLIDGGGGADVLRGDAGADTFNYRAGDAVSGETINGGSEIDRIVAIGAAVSGDIFQAGGVDLTALSFNSIEQLNLNGTEAVISVNAVNQGLSTFVGRTGFRDQLTITGIANGSLQTLSLVNWDLTQDTIAVVGTSGSDNVTGSIGQDIFLGLEGADIFDGQMGDDRFLILENDFNPLDQFSGDIGNDVLQVDCTAITTVQMAPLTDLRGLTLNGIEVLDVVKGSFKMDASDFVGAITGTTAAPVTSTTGLNRVIGNGDGSAANIVLLEIALGTALGIDMRGTVFENWNDGFYIDKLVRIVAGTQTQVIYCPNEETWVNASAATGTVIITGGNQFDQIFGSNFLDYVIAGDSGDYVASMGAGDFVDGGGGNDTVYGGAGNDTLGGGTGVDSLYGEGDSDLLVGGAENDMLDGGAGIDFLLGGAGQDQLLGGADVDYARYDDVGTTNVTVRLDNTAMNTGNAAGDTYNSIEGIICGAGNDTISGNGDVNYLVGGNGNDMIYGQAGGDSLDGGGGGDNLWGGIGADLHVGGNDAAIDYARYDDANHGNLTIRLDAPNLNTGVAAGDTYSGIEGLVGGLGADTVVGDGLGNYLFGGGAADSIFGQAGSDYLSGDAGGDNLWGGAGADQHIGGNDTGVDYARYDDANWGNLTIRLDAPAFNVGAVAVGDTYTGIEGLVGGAGNDVVIGNASNNYLFGSGGSDFIDGQGGSDYLNGGAGADRFRFSTTLAAANVDSIADFAHGVDDILLTMAIFAGIGATLDAAEFRIGMAQDANDFILYNNITGQLFYDSNGSTAGGMIQFATVTAGTVLDVGDFVMV